MGPGGWGGGILTMAGVIPLGMVGAAAGGGGRRAAGAGPEFSLAGTGQKEFNQSDT